MALSKKTRYLIGTLATAGVIVAALALWVRRQPGETTALRVALRPAWETGLDETPPEVREFLGRVLAKLPDGGAEVTGYRFHHWKSGEKATTRQSGSRRSGGSIRRRSSPGS